MKVVRVSFYEPKAVGDGGYHRAYQVVHDLSLAVGGDNIIPVNVPPPWYAWQPWPAAPVARQGWSGRLRRRLTRGRWQRRLARAWQNPYTLLAKSSYSPTGYLTEGFLAYYEQVLAAIHEPAVCVLENTSLSEVLAINEKYHLPTLSCSQNIEAFDTEHVSQTRWGMRSVAVNFAREFQILAQCAERLVISRVEAGLLGGLGLATHYYPYLPVGEIEQRLADLRQRRAPARLELGLLVMIGSAGHSSTRAGFKWFCEQAQQHGLPPNVRVVVAGNGTQSLLPAGVRVPGLELRGWLEQNELDDLLERAQGVLVPQRSGFGALTRLPELAAAGLPAIVPAHPLLAMDPPPGLVVVAEDDWPAWCAAMTQLAASASNNPAEYAAWAARQARPLAKTLLKLLPGTQTA